MKPRLLLNGLQIILWKQTPINFKELYYRAAVKIKMSRFHWGCGYSVCTKKIDVLGVYIDGKLNFNEHVHRICSKASAQISALQRLTGLIDYVWFFTSRESINKIDKIQERALRFVLKDQSSNNRNLLRKSGYDSFRIYAVKSLVIELFKILEGMTPNYLSELFVKADTPYDTRDKFKLIQPLKRTTTYGLRSFKYYGAHVWNMLPVNMKAAQSLRELKSLIRSWPGLTCSCQLCVALLW